MWSVDRIVWNFLRRGQRALWTLRRPRPLPPANAKAQLEIFIALNERLRRTESERDALQGESRFHFFGSRLEEKRGENLELWGEGSASVACRM